MVFQVPRTIITTPLHAQAITAARTRKSWHTGTKAIITAVLLGLKTEPISMSVPRCPGELISAAEKIANHCCSLIFQLRIVSMKMAKKWLSQVGKKDNRAETESEVRLPCFPTCATHSWLS